MQQSQAPRLTIEEAILNDLETVLDKLPDSQASPEDLRARIGTSVAWTTWSSIADLVDSQARALQMEDPSVRASIIRTAATVVQSVERHDRSGAPGR